MYYNNYLIHVNNNHMPAGSKKGGQFASGDGDNDGIVDDHHHYSKNKSDLNKSSNSKKTISESTVNKGKNYTEENSGNAKKAATIATAAVAALIVAYAAYSIYSDKKSGGGSDLRRFKDAKDVTPSALMTM